MEDQNTSSRIFVRGLPPKLNEQDFRKHFSSGGREITETRLFGDRRIGYVGYKSPEDAASAVKYFNKSFVRMSRIGVEIARPPQSHSKAQPNNAPIAPETTSEPQPQNKDDTKLKEFLQVMQPKSKKRAWEQDEPLEEQKLGDNQAIGDQADDSDYDDLPRNVKRSKQEPLTPDSIDEESQQEDDLQALTAGASQKRNTAVSNDAWAKSRMLAQEAEETPYKEMMDTNAHSTKHTQEEILHSSSESQHEAIEQIRKSMRLFLRNLSYNMTQEDLEAEFASFGHLEEVHIAASKKTGAGKGFAYAQFTDPDAAEQAYRQKDGQIFQGRLLHILPATSKRSAQLDTHELAKLPLKMQKQIQRRREASSTNFNWNTLYMNPDAVVSSVAAQLGVAKSAVLDPTSSDAAVKQAHAETHIIQETKSYFKSQGVDLDAFKRSQRGETVVLVKNVPYDTSRDDIRRLFEEHGQIRRFLMPPSGVIAIIEMSNAVQAQAAFSALAYKRLKSSMLFLEKGPKDLFNSSTPSIQPEQQEGKAALWTTDLKGAEDDQIVKPAVGTATLFVRNLNFDTTNQQLSETFSPLTGFISARVKTKTDPKKPGQILSMGFGFVEFREASDAQAALRTMDGYTLHGHKLQVRASNKATDTAAKQKREAGQQTKVIIKNLPFEVSKKEVRALFGAYGQLRSVRVPKKMDRAARGFAFADFTTPKEAQSAIDALKDTHLLGRRLVLDFADEDPVDAEAEIERMAAKVGNQANAVAVQRLTGQGRKKFSTRRDEDEEV